MQYRILLCKGATKSHTTIRNGERCSTAKAYLRPAMSRSNLHVITNAHVTKVIKLVTYFSRNRIRYCLFLCIFTKNNIKISHILCLIYCIERVF